MNKDINTLTEEELGKLFPISIVHSNSEWPKLYIQERNNLIDLLDKNRILQIEHFGSTAVPNLAAKPIIDLLVEIPKAEKVKEEIIDILKSNGYDFIPRNDCPPPYLMFVKGYTSTGIKGQCYHIHMAPKEHTGLWDRLFFRDYLIANSKIASDYENLKKDMAIKYKFNREHYTNAKTEFIQRVTRIAKKNKTTHNIV